MRVKQVYTPVLHLVEGLDTASAGKEAAGTVHYDAISLGYLGKVSRSAVSRMSFPSGASIARVHRIRRFFGCTNPERSQTPKKKVNGHVSRERHFFTKSGLG